jgi:hypothetical protein
MSNAADSFTVDDGPGGTGESVASYLRVTKV